MTLMSQQKLNKELLATMKNNIIKLMICSISLFTISACSETKEVKIEEKPAVTEDAKDLNVNVNVDQAGAAQTPVTRDTTNVVVKNDDSSSKEVAAMNASIVKLQQQLQTANAQSKAEINKQIEKMNADKLKLEKQVADLQNKNAMAQQQAQKAEADRINSESLSVTKEQYKDSVNTKLDNFNTKVADLKLKVDSLSDSSKAAVETEITKLEDRRSQIETKLIDIDNATDLNTLKTVRSQIDSMMTDVDKKYTVLAARPELAN